MDALCMYAFGALPLGRGVCLRCVTILMPPLLAFVWLCRSTHASPSASVLASDAYAGLSTPLYEIVDCLFQLQSRGFFRRQVLSVARQVVSLVAGDVIDVLVMSHLRQARQEHVIGRVLAFIQSQLWPGGVWYQLTPQYIENQRRGPAPPVPGPGNPRGRPPPMEPDNFLTPG